MGNLLGMTDFPEFIANPGAPSLDSPAGGASSFTFQSFGSGGDKLATFKVCRIEEKHNMCLGKIGDGDVKVCSKKKSECAVNTHESRKHQVKEAIYVIPKNESTVFWVPQLKVPRLSEEAQTMFESLELTNDQWKDLFAMVISSAEEVLSEDGLENLLQTSMDVKPIVSTVNETSLDSDLEDEVEKLVKSEGIESSLGSMVRKLTTSVRDLELGRDQDATARDDILKTIGDSKIISWPKAFSRNSIWTTISELATAHIKLAEEKMSGSSAVKVTGLQNTMKTYQQSFSSLVKAIHDTRGEDATLFRNMLARLSAVELRAGVTGGSFNFASLEGIGSPNPLPPKFDSTLQDQLAKLQEEVSQLTSLVSSTTSENATLTSLLTESRLQLGTLSDDVDGFKKIMANGKLGSGDRKIVAFGGLNFRHQDDAAALIRENKSKGALQFGFLYDIYLFSRLIGAQIEGDSKILHTLTQLEKLSISDMRTAMAVNAFSSPIPTVYAKPKDKDKETEWDLSSQANPFTRYSSYDKFEAAVDVLQEKADNCKTKVLARLYTQMPHHTKIRALYELSIAASANCFVSLNQFILGTMKTLRQNHFKPDEAYLLAARLALSFFDECQKVRADAQLDFDIKDDEALAASIWHTVTRTLDVQADFLAYNFKNHPVIASAYVRFVVESTRSPGDDKLGDQFKELKKSVENVRRDHLSLKKASDSVGNNVSDAKRSASQALSKATQAGEDVAKLRSTLKSKKVLE